jgi:TP901 family phage tail tape measure protein
MNKTLKIAVILSAYDKMTRVVNDAVNQSSKKLQELQKKSMDLFGKGMGQLAGGAGIAASLAPAVSAYADLEDSAMSLRTVMMKEGGILPGDQFERVNKLAIQLGNKLPGTTSDFQNMFAAMIRGGVAAENILGGTGQAAAYLAVQLKLPYEEAAIGAARMKEATGVLDAEMMGFMDTISRLDNVGVKFEEMRYAFSRSAGQLKFLGIQGLEATNQVAALYAMLVKGGASGETVGTGMSAAFSNIFDQKKMAAANDAAKKLGFQFQFIDKQGNFKGVENFVKQLDKLKGMSEQQISDVLAPLFGATGQDSQFIKSIAQGGFAAYTQMQARMKDQASLQEKVTAQLGTLKNLWDATTGTFTNAMAAFGEAIGPELKMLTELLGQLSEKMQAFFANNPRLAKFLGMMVAGVGVFMMVLGVINLVKGAMVALNVVMLMNPWVLMAAAALAAVTLIYAYWEPIKGWFTQLWADVKLIFANAVVGLVELAVAPVKAIETAINKVKELTGVGTQTNFMDTSKLTQDIYNNMGVKLPATPAPAPAPGANASGGAVLNYSPSIQLNGAATPNDKDAFQKMLNTHQEDMMRKFQSMQERKEARQF